MRRAYRFRKDIVPDFDPLNGELTSISDFTEDHREGDQYRCRSTKCFGPVHPKLGSHCFAHNDNTAKADCRYYYPSKWTPRSVAMDVALSELASTVNVKDFDITALEARFEYPDGQGVLTYLTQEKARRLYKGELELDHSTKFVITLVDLAELNKRHLRPILKKILEDHNLIALPKPKRAGGDPEGRPAIVSQGFTFKDLKFVGVTLGRVDWDRLFGIDHPKPYTVYLKPACRKEFRVLSHALDAHEISAEGSKVLRLLAKRVLIEGAALHHTIFRQTRAAAEDLTRSCDRFPKPDDLVDTAELSRLSTDDAFINLLREHDVLREQYSALADAVRERERADRESTAKRVASLEADNKRLKTDNKRLDNALSHAQSTIKGLKTDVAKATTRIGLLRTENRNLQSRLDLAQKTVDSQEALLETAQGDAAELEKQLAAAKGKIEALETERDRLKDELTAARKTIAELKAKNKRLGGQLTETRETITSLEVKTEHLEGELTEARETIAARDQDLVEARNTIGGLQAENDRLGRELAAALRRLGDLRDHALGKFVMWLYPEPSSTQSEEASKGTVALSYLRRRAVWLPALVTMILVTAVALAVVRTKGPISATTPVEPVLATELPSSFRGSLVFDGGEPELTKLTIQRFEAAGNGDLRVFFVLDTPRFRGVDGKGLLDSDDNLRISESQMFKLTRDGGDFLLTGVSGVQGELRGRVL